MYKYTTISFPALGLEWDPIRVLNIGPLSIHLYGAIIATGLMLAVLYAWRRCKHFGINEDYLTDGVLGVVPFAIICARAYYCAFQWEEFADDPVSVLYIWNGGIAIYGGVIGTVIGVAVYSKIRKMKLSALLDLVALGFLIGQSIGRWGNFFNREAFGSETDIFLRMGLFNTETGKTEFHHPTFLYESLWNAVGFLVLHLLSYRRKYDGQIALGYVVWYGLGRAFIEGLRTDSLYWGPFRVSQLLAAVSSLAAAAVLVVLSFREHRPEQMACYVAPEAPAEEPAAEAPSEEVPEEPAEEPAEQTSGEAAEAPAKETE